MHIRNSIKTWMIESAVVAVILFTTVFYRSFRWTELLCATAVLITFMHAQVADRMQEKQLKMTRPDVHCYKWSARYFLIKESLWIVFFIMIASYAALLGSVVFFLYPFWRNIYNKYLRKKDRLETIQ